MSVVSHAKKRTKELKVKVFSTLNIAIKFMSMITGWIVFLT